MAAAGGADSLPVREDDRQEAALHALMPPG